MNKQKNRDMGENEEMKAGNDLWKSATLEQRVEAMIYAQSQVKPIEEQPLYKLLELAKQRENGEE